MYALISATAGLAIFVHGNEADVISMNDVDAEITYPLYSVPYLLAGVKDTKRLQNISKKDTVSALRDEYNKNRALTLTLIMLDEDEEDATVALSAECLCDLLSDAKILYHLENILYSNALPKNVNLYRAKQYAEKIECLYLILDDIGKRQSIISDYRNRWNCLSEELFDNHFDKYSFEHRLIVSGAFTNFVKAVDDQNKYGLAIMQCLEEFRDIKDSRYIITKQWLSGAFPTKTKKKAAIAAKKQLNTLVENCDNKTRKRKITAHAAFMQATKQIEAIVPLLKKADWDRTRRYVNDLMKSQSKISEPEHIAKSLCNLSQHSKVVHNYSLQLELAKKAAEVATNDAWACAQVADAYICLSQYDNATQWLKYTEIYGDREYAQTGYARILRDQERYPEAIEAFEKLLTEFPESAVISNCYAEILKDVGRFEDALSVYGEAILKFHDDPSCHCGKASTYKSLGKLNDALQVYSNAKQLFGNDVYIGAGIAEIYKLKGEFDDAIHAYDEIIKKFSEIVILRCGKASVYRAMEKYDIALKEYQSISRKFPYDIASKLGIAETLKECGRLEDSLIKYDEIIKEYPASKWPRNGKANVLKVMRQYEYSLQTYDQNIKEFPYDLVAWKARADLLKQLGYFEESIDAYTRISVLNPYDQSASFSKAAIYGAIGAYDKALELLPTKAPQTRDEWLAHHIRGMIYLKSGKVEKAFDFFEEAFSKLPFYQLKKHFTNALAVASLRLQKPQSISTLEDGLTDCVKEVLSIHAYGQSNQLEKAEKAYIRIIDDCPPYIITLRDELAAQYLKQFKTVNYDADWIFSEECKILLLDAA